MTPVINSVVTSNQALVLCVNANNVVFNAVSNYRNNPYGVKLASDASKKDGCPLICEYMTANKSNPAAMRQALAQGETRGCLSKLTIRDYQPQFFAWYDKEVVTLKALPACAKYKTWADEIALDARQTEELKRASLLDLFFDAQAKGCR